MSGADVRAVFFDVDGVLVRPWRFRDWLVREHGILPEHTATFFRGPFLECVEGRADLLEVLPRWLLEWGWKGGVASFVERWFAVENDPDAAVLEIAARVRDAGLRCFAASTQERHRAAYLAGEMGLASRFEQLFFSCDVGARKPHAAFFREVARRVELPAAALLLIDDTPANVQGARDAGWQAELFTTAEILSRRLRELGVLGEAIAVSEQPSPEDIAFLDARIDDHNEQTTGFRDGRPLAILLRDESAAIYAGLSGHTWGGVCDVKLLWVDRAHRGRGLGRRLLQAAEDEAVRRGCGKIVLTTHSFQAPDLYRRLGYAVVGEVRDYPRGYTHLYLEKALR